MVNDTYYLQSVMADFPDVSFLFEDGWGEEVKDAK